MLGTLLVAAGYTADGLKERLGAGHERAGARGAADGHEPAEHADPPVLGRYATLVAGGRQSAPGARP